MVSRSHHESHLNKKRLDHTPSRVRASRGQTEFQVNLKLGLTPRSLKALTPGQMTYHLRRLRFLVRFLGVRPI